MSKLLRTLRARWRAKTPLFWLKIHRLMLILTALQTTIIALLGNFVVKENIAPWLVELMQYTLTTTVVATLLSKLTVEDPKKIEDESKVA